MNKPPGVSEGREKGWGKKPTLELYSRADDI